MSAPTTATSPAKVRVVVIDDSAVIRRLVSGALTADPAVDVVATARNGLVGLEAIDKHDPDVVTLDIEMPEMDGLTALREIRKRWPRLPVIMFSTLTERGAAATLEALSCGANDYVTKPSGTSGIDDAIARVASELVPRVKSLAAATARHRVLRSTSAAAAGDSRLAPRRPAAPAARADSATAPGGRSAVPATRPTVRRPFGRVDVLAIGASTGGPAALEAIIPVLPGDLGVPVVIVQHMPAVFTRLLAERLDKASALTVVEGDDGMAVTPGTVYIAPGGRHMTLGGPAGATIALNDDPPEHSCRPAVDVLFRSVAACHGSRALGVILTGMGSDGTAGARQMRDAGAHIYIQDEESSVVWGMPGSASRAGVADIELPLADMAAAITTAIRSTPRAAAR